MSGAQSRPLTQWVGTAFDRGTVASRRRIGAPFPCPSSEPGFRISGPNAVGAKGILTNLAFGTVGLVRVRMRICRAAAGPPTTYGFARR